jgi:hypothetical protein
VVTAPSGDSDPVPTDTGAVRGKAVRYAVYPTSAAVSSMRRWPFPGTTPARSDPPTDAPMPKRPVHFTTRHRTKPSRL